jgi:predicted MFS family arabinose efflux permease
MTQVCGSEREQQEPGKGSGGQGYLALLRMPQAVRFSAAAMLGRVPMSMFGLGTVLLLVATTGKYGLAGAVAGAGSVGYAICSPQLARMADRFGQRRVLRPVAAFFAVSTIAFVTFAELRLPIWLVALTGCLAGASMPSLGSMVRARWSALLGDSLLLHTAFAVESVADEFIFVLGPAVVTLLATDFLPASGVLVAMVACLIGTLLFAAQRGTEPTPTKPDAAPTGLARQRRRLPAQVLRTLLPVYFFLGAMFATVDLSTVDFAQREGHKPLAGLILGTFALGSAIGGLWYGSRSWRASLERRFSITLCIAIAGFCTLWTLPGLLSLDLVGLLAGLAISPTLIGGFSLIERDAPDARKNEGMAWLSSSISVGVATGSAVAGQIIDGAGPRWGYVFAAVCGLSAVVVCVLGLGGSRATRDTQAAQWVDAES